MGKIGGDTNLSARGRMYAAALARYFNDAAIPNLHVWTSEKKRTKQTAQDIQALKEHISALNELDAVSWKVCCILQFGSERRSEVTRVHGVLYVLHVNVRVNYYNFKTTTL